MAKKKVHRLKRLLREHPRALTELTHRFDALARFSVSVDERVEELGETVKDLRSANPDALSKSHDRQMDRMQRQVAELREGRRSSLLHPSV